MGFLIRLLVTAGALWVATAIVDGIDVTADTTWGKIGTYLLVALIFGLVNAIIKPIVKLVGCVFYALTLGLIALVVNALLFLLVGWLAGVMNIPFEVNGFWAGFWGAIIVGVVSWVVNLAFGTSKNND
ncbi:MAG: phage holin family protein [Hamadaea sp.]|uniref:phage holin family protein n=1 Tax=Hamadaea sp. TaxID=2024425 RepID=UPI001848A8ED|nr:phage holin family protein [Hamadaea sp.]NUR69900.1 phage holin family protein [Hamadaea sp.]NUT22096.1 phage holin family protein [Hamadaea sp.]